MLKLKVIEWNTENYFWIKALLLHRTGTESLNFDDLLYRHLKISGPAPETENQK